MTLGSRLGFLGALLFAAAGLLSSAPAAGDWLVLTGGSAVETRGPWQVKGRLVVFTTPDGTFSSLRLADVDLEASSARTAAAKARALEEPKAEVEPEPPRKARFVVTDADVGHVEDVAPLARKTGAEGEATAENPGREVAPEENPLEVISWDAVLGPTADGVAIQGVVSNPSEYFATGISIKVTPLDLEGAEMEAQTVGMVDSEALAPNQQGPFRAEFPGVFSVGNALFEVTSFNAVVSDSP